MLRKFIQKYYNFILWTNKWHFFHIIFITSCLASILGLSFGIEATIYDLQNFGYTYDETLYSLIIFPAGFHIFSIIISLFFAIIIETFILIKRAIAHESLCVHSSFLNNNKIYNNFYIFAASIALGTLPTMFLIAILILIGENIYLYLKTNNILFSFCKDFINLLFC